MKAGLQICMRMSRMEAIEIWWKWSAKITLVFQDSFGSFVYIQFYFLYSVCTYSEKQRS